MKRVGSVEEMRELGSSLGSQCRAGDLILLHGPLGAGKTALTQGIGRALGISDITSPTFVISRVHPGRLPLVHVDAYRLLGSKASNLEFDDLDLDINRDEVVTVIEWGGDIGIRLGDDYLAITLDYGDSDDERTISYVGHGPRWQGFTL